MKIKKLPKSIYPVNISIILIDSWKEFEDKFGIKKDEYTSATSWQKTINDFYIIFNKKYFKFEIVVHELVHIVNFTFDYIGYTPSVINDEAQAYYMEYLFKNTIKFLEDEKIIKLQLLDSN